MPHNTEGIEVGEDRFLDWTDKNPIPVKHVCGALVF